MNLTCREAEDLRPQDQWTSASGKLCVVDHIEIRPLEGYWDVVKIVLTSGKELTCARRCKFYLNADPAKLS